MDTKLRDALDKIVAEFAIDKAFLCKATNQFLASMDAGLANDTPTREYMPMIPTYVTSIPTGKEKGLFLAADLGGTNFRVCSIDLKGDHTFDLKQSKSPVPLDLMKGASSDNLFSFLAEKVQNFLVEHHSDLNDTAKLKLGFTFSFPVEQTALDRGKLIRWTKGFDLPDCVGRDVVEMLQKHIDILNIPVTIVALANDTVGTLLSRAYVNDSKKTNSNTVIGCIFGTGTNGAYFENISNIPKLAGATLPKDIKGMVINTEWGSFDNSLEILPRTKFDDIVDKETSNKGYHLFEKRISGMFLGELLRVTLIELFNEGHIFTDLYKSRGNNLPHRLTEPFLLSSEVLSYLQIDDSTELRMSELILENQLRLPTTAIERQVIQELTQAISNRAAHLSAIPLAAIVMRVKDQYASDDKDLEVGCDGSVVEFYPGFQKKILDALHLIDPLKGSKKRIHLKIAKDGSGVGAALCASTV
ncbi:CIC11C00000001438 [Sungouiella intermedia]|uniref:Phosphotransferase n=1 Tax=Sungouiella intermedia TaxID=45354 RepID=A0A1L0BGU4_9ASCO|nr:CIC11C00000001438 [[Candida] intermedia]